ncbi:phosphoenolpyruvate--protein phosphotransferase [Streptococcus suis]|nr:phosphoenolpyruvate--protein phosphotransferase [Streptococcus suis]
MTEMLKGIAASDGVAVAKAYLLVQPDLSFETVTVEDTNAEEARLDAALEASQNELSVIRENAVASLGEEAAAVFDAHLMVLADPEMIGQIKETIRAKKTNAETGLKEVTDMFIAIFEGMEDNPYMQERAADIRDVAKRVLAHLLGVRLPNPATIDEESIVIAHDLTPSDTAQLNKQLVKAFVTNIGGRTSHSAIMARTLEIAAVLGTNNITEIVKDGDVLAVNGITGDVVINPSEEVIAEFKAAGEAYAKQKAEWALLKDAQTVTADGKHFELAANIGTPKDVEGVNDNGAEAVGLYRTEFLYMDSQDFPTEDEQYEAYKAVLEGMNGKPVVVRTMDIGGDKELPYFDLPHEMNPFLGFRALRISISETGNQMFRTQLRALRISISETGNQMFRTQLRALLRSSVHGKLRIMFPMVALLTEFRAAKAILDEEKANLLAEGVAVADDIQVGIMIEIPAAAMLADQFAKEVDFFSIGTNDLIQYTMAADRMNEQVSYLYQPYNPSILRLINNVIKAAHAEGKWAGMCGEMAGDQQAVPLLVGMGLDEFSMSATSVLRTRSLMKKLDTAKMEEYAHRALTECATAEEVLELQKEYVDFD